MTQEEASTLFEQKIVHACAPTLAALKPASMFSVRFAETCECQKACLHCRCRSMQKAAFEYAMARAREQLSGQGVHVHVLAMHAESALLLVYRPALLEEILAHPQTRAFLITLGYPTESVESSVTELAARARRSQSFGALSRRETFPHEVGFFLGYPYRDVVSFMSGRQQCACIGCWKAYGDAESARECFDAYKRCTRHMELAHAQGATLMELAQMAA